jgi:hypothetical protein
VIAKQGIEEWHRIVRNMSAEALDEVLAEDCVFHSPVVHTPQEGKAITKLYLQAAFGVLGKPASGGARTSEPRPFYVREVVGERDAVLEFVTEVDGIVINGVDLIRWNDDDRIVDFKVMIRPLKAVNKLHQMMAKMLEHMKPA